MPLLNWELQFIVPIRCNEHAQHFRGFRKALVLTRPAKCSDKLFTHLCQHLNAMLQGESRSIYLWSEWTLTPPHFPLHKAGREQGGGKEIVYPQDGTETSTFRLLLYLRDSQNCVQSLYELCKPRSTQLTLVNTAPVCQPRLSPARILKGPETSFSFLFYQKVTIIKAQEKVLFCAVGELKKLSQPPLSDLIHLHC